MSRFRNPAFEKCIAKLFPYSNLIHGCLGLLLLRHLSSWGRAARDTQAKGRSIQPLLPDTWVGLPVKLRHPLSSRPQLLSLSDTCLSERARGSLGTVHTPCCHQPSPVPVSDPGSPHVLLCRVRDGQVASQSRSWCQKWKLQIQRISYGHFR